MVEGDLVDLTLPSLLQAVSREGLSAVLRLQRGTDQGVLHFREGALVHALSGGTSGDAAVQSLLTWSDGRFRLVRDMERQPRTVTRTVDEFLFAVAQPAGGSDAVHFVPAPDASPDDRLLSELLTLLTRLEQDRVRLADGRVERGGVSALLVVTAVVNSLVAFVTARSSDLSVLPSRVLPQLSEAQPYTQLLGEDNERISVATAASVLKTWSSDKEDRRQLFLDLCRALLDVLVVYGNAAGTFFHGSREREEWRATIDVFVDGLWAAVQELEV